MIAVVCFVSSNVFGHCQIPCGIYDDELRISLLREHITTMEKSMKTVVDLSGTDMPDHNQLVRWVVNKDEHADAFSQIVTKYFLAQRIKPVEGEAGEKYLKEVRLLHEMIVYSMKVKQTTEQKHIDKLRSLVDAFEESYFSKAEHRH